MMGLPLHRARRVGQILYLLATLNASLAFQFPGLRHVSRQFQEQKRTLRQAVEVRAPSYLELLSRLSSTQTSREIVPTEQEKKLPEKTLIIGGGPSGLFSAIALARRGYKNIEVFDRLSRPDRPDSPSWGDPYRSYNLGIGGRGQVGLRAMEAWQTIDTYAAVACGRKDWTPNGEEPEKIYSHKKYQTRVIQRDRLASCLLTEVEENYSDSVKVKYGVECTKIVWNQDGKPTVTLKESASTEQLQISADFVIGADGVKSAIRDAMEGDTLSLKQGFKVKRFPDINIYVYKTIPLSISKREGWRGDLNYSCRTKYGITLEALPTKEGIFIGIVLFRPGEPRVENIKSAGDAKAFFQELFPDFVVTIDEKEYELFASKPINRLPSFAYCGPVLHRGNSTVLLGDTIHLVKPYFGLGVNAAFEDVITLDQCLQDSNDNLNEALPLFSKVRAKEAKALVELQHSFDVNASTALGFIQFVLPLILDGILSKAAPKVFAPNSIQLLQNEKNSFTYVRNRKRLDRVMQLGLFVAVGFVIKTVVQSNRVIKLCAAAVGGAMGLFPIIQSKLMSKK